MHSPPNMCYICVCVCVGGLSCLYSTSLVAFFLGDLCCSLVDTVQKEISVQCELNNSKRILAFILFILKYCFNLFLLLDCKLRYLCLGTTGCSNLELSLQGRVLSDFCLHKSRFLTKEFFVFDNSINMLNSTHCICYLNLEWSIQNALKSKKWFRFV